MSSSSCEFHEDVLTPIALFEFQRCLGHRLKVLVFDDDQDGREFIRTTLT